MKADDLPAPLLPLDDLARRNEGADADGFYTTRSQEESVDIAAGCFIAFIVGMAVLYVLHLFGVGPTT